MDSVKRNRIPTSPEVLRELEAGVFDDGGQALDLIRAHARYLMVPPLALLVLLAQRALVSLPVGAAGPVLLYTGAGSPAPPSLFVAIAGYPGGGKDQLMSRAAALATVGVGEKTCAPKELQLGSGEGIEEALLPDDGGHTSPVLFRESEITKISALLRREGNTMGSTLLAMWSGNSLGSTTRQAAKTVPAGSYHAALVVGVQPLHAGVLLNNNDAGLTHRVVWCDSADPARTVGQHYDKPERDLPKVAPGPEELTRGFTVPESVSAFLRREREVSLVEGPGADGYGHKNLVRARLAAGLALLRSTTTITEEDWRRAGLLMDYSDHVRGAVLTALREADAVAAVDQDRQEADKRRKRAADHIAKRMGQQSEWKVSGDGGLRTAARMELRDEVVCVLGELVARQVVEASGEVTATGVRVWRGPRWGEWVATL